MSADSQAPNIQKYSDIKIYDCPICYGHGEVLGNNFNNTSDRLIYVKCPGCEGTGKIVLHSKL